MRCGFWSLLALIQASCANDDPASSVKQENAASDDARPVKELRIPTSAVPCCTHVLVKMPEKFLYPDGSNSALTFKRLDFRTGEPIDDSAVDQESVISLSVNRAIFDFSDDSFRKWKRYPQGNEIRFGLEYRPILIPGRPEKLLKRGYFKEGVSGEEFYISCTPPIGPNSISKPISCRMHLQLHPTNIKGKIWGAYIGVDFSEAKLADWQEIELATLRHFEGRIEVVSQGIETN